MNNDAQPSPCQGAGGRGAGHGTTARATRDVAGNSARIDIAGPRTRMVRDHAVMKRLVAGPAGHVIVHGLEGLGLRVVEHLVALGLEVVAVDDGARPGAIHAATALGATIVPHHDGAAAALGAAGLRDARAVICLSSTDLGALETALLARRLRPEVGRGQADHGAGVP